MKVFKRTIFTLFLLGLLFIAFFFYWWVYGGFWYPLKPEVQIPGHQFSLAAELPVKITESGGAALGDHFYVVGGLGPVGNTYSHFFRYSHSKDEWTRMEDFPDPINHPGVTAGSGKLFVAGGFDPLGIRPHGFMLANWYPRNQFFIFDPKTESWNRGPDLPEPRGAGGICHFDSAVYYAGGINPEKVVSASLFKYDLRTNKWETLPPMLTSRDHMRMEAVNGTLYAISGRKDDLRHNLGVVEAYDIATETWSTKADFPFPRGGFGSAVLNGKIYTYGGEYVWTSLDFLERYDPEADLWESIGSLPEPRHGILSGVIEGEIHLVSGGLRPRIAISGIHRVLSPDSKPNP